MERLDYLEKLQKLLENTDSPLTQALLCENSSLDIINTNSLILNATINFCPLKNLKKLFIKEIINMCVSVCVCVCLSIYIYVYIYMYIHIHIYTLYANI